ncbi:MAG: hypothetical protein ACRDK1_09985 [Solirubrobacterales bacterium]
MPEQGGPEPFVSAGLELLGLPADEAELAVIEAVDGLYRPLVDALIAAELDGIEPEPGEDLSRAPRGLDSR